MKIIEDIESKNLGLIGGLIIGTLIAVFYLLNANEEVVFDDILGILLITFFAGLAMFFIVLNELNFAPDIFSDAVGNFVGGIISILTVLMIINKVLEERWDIAGYSTLTAILAFIGTACVFLGMFKKDFDNTSKSRKEKTKDDFLDGL